MEGNKEFGVYLVGRGEVIEVFFKQEQDMVRMVQKEPFVGRHGRHKGVCKWGESQINDCQSREMIRTGVGYESGATKTDMAVEALQCGKRE